MIRQIAAAFALALQVFATAAMAADNAVVLTPGVGVTMRTKDVGAGVQSSITIPGDTSGNPLATAPGTPNSVFALPVQGVASGTPIPVSSATLGTAANQATAIASLATIATNSSAPIPCAVTAAWNTNTGLTLTQPASCNGSANLYVDLGKNNGSAGTASTSVLSVQGIASMTPLLVAGSVSNASSGVATGAANAASVAYNYGFNGTTWDQLQVDGNKNLKVLSINGAADPCQTQTHTYTPINYSASGLNTTPLIAGTSAKKTYVCHITVQNNALDAIGIIETTTGTSCATDVRALWGGATHTSAAAGWNFSANGGIALGNSSATIAQTSTNNDDVCFIQSVATQVTGGVEWVQQ